jgi:magnesium chelatase family protein
VEVDCSGIKCDQDHFHTVGLPDAAVRESRDRVRAALKNCGYDIPPTQITINLAPADIKKEGSGFDLPMALGIVGAYGGLTKKEISDCLFVGELSLDGGVRSVRGALPIAVEARGQKISRMVVPEANAKEAAMVGGVALCINGMDDHVHLLVRMPSTQSVADVARLIKTNSSRWVLRAMAAKNELRMANRVRCF